MTKAPAANHPRADGQPYGDLTALNRDGQILRLVGADMLRDIVEDYLGLLGTSAAVYERNGDYATGIFSSGWCRTLDAASRAGCGTTDNATALACGQWRCHESCWRTSRQSIETNQPADLGCDGGIRIYAVPVVAKGEVVGSLNFGYGTPPAAPEALAEISTRYALPVAELGTLAADYQPRPAFIVEAAKVRLRAAARLVGAIIERREAEEALAELNAVLDRRVEDRTAQMRTAMDELEAFSYSVSHDLRAPLRAIDGFSGILVQDYGRHLDDEGRRLLEVIRNETRRMGALIDGLLTFSRLNRQAPDASVVDMRALALSAWQDAAANVERPIRFEIGELPPARGDLQLLRQVWVNLLANAVKFTRDTAEPAIEVGGAAVAGEHVYYVCDNGAGFDMRHSGKLFGVFQRLHSDEQFEGTGIGLASVRRIVLRHGGRVWAEGEPDGGAAFYFSLPDADAPRAEGPA